MFDLIQIPNDSRNALLTIPPVYTSRKPNDMAIYVMSNAPSISPIIIPEGLRVRKMSKWLKFLLRPFVAMVAPTGILLLNPTHTRLLTEIVIHELTHYIQHIRMGLLSYIATYIAQMPSALWKAFRKGGSWHDHHLMEREAHRIAEEVIRDHYYDENGNYLLERETVPFDAFKEIQKRLKD